MKFPLNIARGAYTMASVDGETAELIMYGDIVETQPTDFWTGEPIPGNYIIESEFLEDLERVQGCKALTIRMNSCGGDAGVSVLIHNRLRELAANGVELTCIVDGVAMSGGSLIMCACDTVRVNPSSLVMIHKCWSFLFGGYSADELRQQASRQDAWDKSQVSIYTRKSKLSATVISHMMADTTYMTGREAVEKGFADEVIEDAEPLDIAASADGRTLFIRGREMHLTPGMFAPDTIPTVTPEAAAPVETHNPPDNSGTEGGTTMAKNLKELRAENPELAEALMAEAKAEAAASASGSGAQPPAAGNGGQVQAAGDPADTTSAVDAERKRIQDIDALAGLFDAETINAAKYGDHPCTAQEMVYQAAQKAAQQGQKFLAALEADTAGSGAQEVEAANGGGEGAKPTTPEGKMAQARASVKALFKNDKEE
ncbi:head maturation protease, ClpP-related [uncultured Dysosmobacter sp.]|uniref:head maturation protease, ClpP-related n=1 Tax=uncultured Dysosmobacter sp. TaxID=2591384 RepID=UPI0026124771|nr:head maturation protease, ClpP-related [uncultured Dysosmobacter sp.]